jgi:hypothetical protein
MGMRQGFADHDTDPDSGTRSSTRAGSGADPNAGSDAAANTQYDVHRNVAGRRRLRVMFGRRGLWFQHLQGLPETQ